jgi:hypothetical protein
MDRWIITRITQPLATLAFALGAWLALRQFPAEFDWRRVVISALQSPRDNPQGYGWISLGLALSGLLLLPLIGYFGAVLAPWSPRGARLVRRLLGAGILGMVLVALFTHRPAFYPRLHENLAFLAYCSLVLGLLATTLLFMRHPGATLLADRAGRKWLLPLLAAAIFGPLLAAALSQFAVYAFTEWRAEGLPPWLNLAFWQWILSVLLYTSAWLLAWIAAPAGAPVCEDG